MKSKNIFKTIIGISGFLGLALAATGNAWAGGCFSDSSYVISAANIGSKTSCRDYASNDPGITGCEIPEGGTSCTVTVNDCTITINRSDFNDGVTKTTNFYTVDTYCGAVVTALGFGQQQGSYCAYGLFHSPGALELPGVTIRNTDNKGDDTAIRGMEFCVTDNAFTQGTPVLNVDKRVTTYEEVAGIPSYNCNIASDELTIPAISPSGDDGDTTPPNSTVTYCAYVSNTGTVPIEGVSLVDDKADPAGDLLFFGYEDGTTKDGGPASFDLEIGETILVVYTGIITEPVVNTATVAASGISASDTAEVLVAVTCNDLTEDLADDSKDVNLLGALVTTYTADGTATCAPDGTLSLVCDMAPDDGSQSGNWCYKKKDEVAMCTDCMPTPGNPPYCREVWAHPDNVCDGTGVPPIENEYLTQNTVLVGKINPTVMTFCGSGGGSGTCTIYCFTNGTAVDIGMCPPGSLVY